MTRIWIVAAGIALGCAGNSHVTTNRATLTGTVAYRERMALPPDAEVQVQLNDVSRQDVAATVVAETTFTPAGRQVPLPFELRYDPARIEALGSYAVRATIRSGGTLLFTTTTVTPVLTRGHPDRATLLLARVAASSDASPPASLVGTSWVLEDIGGAGVIDNARATLEFPETGKVAGRGSCNRFFGSVDISGDAMKFGALGATRMACPEAVMHQEGRYFQALENTVRFTMEGPFLFLHSSSLEKSLRFTRETP